MHHVPVLHCCARSRGDVQNDTSTSRARAERHAHDRMQMVVLGDMTRCYRVEGKEQSLIVIHRRVVLG